MRGAMSALFIASRAVCDVIRLVPKCDPTCMKGRLLASYYSGPMAISPVYVSSKSSAPPRAPMVVKSTVRSPDIPKKSTSARAARIPNVIRTTVTSTVLKTVSAEMPRSLQPPIVVMQPRYVMQPVPVALSPMSVGGAPRQSARPSPPRLPVQQQGAGTEAINRIGKRINLIYTMLTTLKQKYLQMVPQRPQRIVVVAPVTTMTVLKTVSITPPQIPTIPVIAQPATIVTPAKPAPQPLQTVKGLEAPGSTSTICVTPPQSIGDGNKAAKSSRSVEPAKKAESRKSDKAHKNTKSRKADSEESDSSRESSSSSEKEKPLYMLKTGRLGRRRPKKRDSFIDCYLRGNPSECNAENSEREPDIGDAVIYKNDFDSDDEIIYLSDLLGR
ncbi:hypothetical protein PFJ87_10g00220 [Encephalitozoon hellem]|uniref:Uncharacterized protein n=2 Tax=Encephalitozoon hellem TaxID=27973 RepID=A0ABY8CL30_ENCHE|nr:hypothetical protein PFJ87_10g00220 [Encephalitozoon hellem]